jgi:hypothetical protein
VIFASIASGIALVKTVMLYAFEVEDRWVQMAGSVFHIVIMMLEAARLIISRLWIVTGFMPISFLLSMTVINSNIAGHTKKLTTQAITFVCHSTGSKSPNFDTLVKYAAFELTSFSCPKASSVRSCTPSRPTEWASGPMWLS